MPDHIPETGNKVHQVPVPVHQVPIPVHQVPGA